jgi:gamma-glutamyltranspeptidase/glutathione hydrolase
MSVDSREAQRATSSEAPASMVQVMGRRWAIAAGHPLAAEAGARMLAAGGNAVDAGVAAGMVLGVVHPDMVSFAGVAPTLVHLAARGETFEVSGVGPYPRGVTSEFFRTRCEGQIPPGVLRTVVPAAPGAWCEALARWGTLSFGQVAEPALACARDGFPLSLFSAHMMKSHAERYARWPSSAKLYLPGGRPREAGELLVSAELGETIERMIRAEAGARARGRAEGIRAARDTFYTGEIAERIVAFHQREGGFLTREDLSSFRAEVAPALRTTFGDCEVAACGFWCQGPVLLQMLNLIEGYDWTALGHNTPRALHILLEAMKLAFADREAYYGDPAHVTIPAAALLSKEYARVRRGLIREDRAWPDMPPPGDPERLAAVRNGAPALLATGAPAAPLDTAYVAVVDAAGNGFSATPSDPCVDSPVVPGVGCVVSPRGSQGWLVPGHPSEVAGGKRPRLTPAPAMAFRGGKLLMPFGTPGGDVQQQAMLQVFLNIVAHGFLPQAAVEAPRVATRSFPDSFWPHTHSPGVVEAERLVPAETRGALEALGHAVANWPDRDWRAGAVCAVLVGPDGARLAGADPRRGSHAIAG